MSGDLLEERREERNILFWSQSVGQSVIMMMNIFLTNIYRNLAPIVCGSLPALGTHCRKGSSWSMLIMIMVIIIRIMLIMLIMTIKIMEMLF